MSDDLVVRFARLFAGRGDAWGAVEGRSVKEKVTLDLFREHLYGEGSVGIYPLVPYAKPHDYVLPGERIHVPSTPDHWRVRWGCIDVDEGYDLIAIALNVHKALKHLGITSWVERTKSKGFHVWSLCSDWVPAEHMVAAQRLACELVDYHPKEVNPKQTSLAPGQFGNYVNLPYARKWVKEGKRVVLNVKRLHDPKLLAEFVASAEAKLNPPDVIAAASRLYKPPKPPQAVTIARPAYDASPRLRGVAKRLFEEGPLPNVNTGHVDRSAGLQRLAHLLRADGFSAGEAYDLVASLDSRLGKYVGRADAELQYQRIIQRAFG